MLRNDAWRPLAGLRHGFFDGRVEPDFPVLRPRQVHGTRVVTADPAAETPVADGLVTATAGMLVGVVTADCAPILMLARDRRVAAAVHAGWRGAAAGVIARALDHLRTFGVEPRDVDACVGPAIGPCCYEVGPEVRDAFVAGSGDVTSTAWSRVGDRDRLDLRAAVVSLLKSAGVRTAIALGPCTRCASAYCSYRRDGANAGRQTSFIGWE